VAFAASRISRDLAEDLAQEVLLLLHDKYAHVSQLEELLPLSLQILRFKMVSLRRKSQRRGEYSQVSVDDLPLADPRSNPERDAQQHELMERLTKAIAQLGERCRDLFRLKLEGKSFAQMQVLLGAGSINTIYTWDFRCRQQLLELMGGGWEVGQ
jgi:RNA polymerase sigma-70 factor (ECF subfamily)